MQASAWDRVLRSPCVLKLRFYVLRLKGALDLFLVLVELHPKVMFWNWKKWSYKYKWYLCLLSILNSASTSLHSFLRSRGSTGRTPAFPSGNLSYPSVRDGNYIASRTLVLLYVCAALQVFWLLEQPCNSVMEALPSFQSFMKDVRTFRHSFCMETYGGPTKKPTWLYSGRLIGIHGCCWYIVLTSDSILRSLFKVHSLIYIYIYQEHPWSMKFSFLRSSKKGTWSTRSCVLCVFFLTGRLLVKPYNWYPWQGKKEIGDLGNFKPRAFELPKHDEKVMVEKYLDKNGVARVKGGPDLKGSQSYPRLLLWGSQSCPILKWVASKLLFQKSTELSLQIIEIVNRFKDLKHPIWKPFFGCVFWPIFRFARVDPPSGYIVPEPKDVKSFI